MHLLVAALLLPFAVTGCKKEARLADPELRRFVEAKQAQARQFIETQRVHMPADGWRLFEAILADDFTTATNVFARLALERSASTNVPTAVTMAVGNIKDMLARRGLYSPDVSALDGVAWQALSEAHWAYVETKTWQKEFLADIVGQIVSTVPTNAVYFGGTDVGRFSVNANIEASEHGRKFFVLTQNQLMDWGYCEYAQSNCKNDLILPDASHCAAAWSSLPRNSPAAIMQASGELVRYIVEQNPTREFFIEQSSIIEWLYPHVVPHGPILKLNRQVLSSIPEETVAADRAYWTAFCRKYIGDWIKLGETPVTEVCEFSERVYLRKELQGFMGDRLYLTDSRAQEYFSKLRLAMAHLYLWRCVEAIEVGEKTRMWQECVLAFEQAFALGPGNIEVASDFAAALVQVKRNDEAIRILKICRVLNPSNALLRVEIERIQKLATSVN